MRDRPISKVLVNPSLLTQQAREMDLASDELPSVYAVNYGGGCQATTADPWRYEVDASVDTVAAHLGSTQGDLVSSAQSLRVVRDDGLGTETGSLEALGNLETMVASAQADLDRQAQNDDPGAS